MFSSVRSHRKRNAPYKKVNPLTGLHLVLNIFGFRHGANSLLSSPHYLRHLPITSLHVSLILPPPPLPFFSTYVGSLALHFIRIFTRIPNRPISLLPPFPRCRRFSDPGAPTAPPPALLFLSKVNSCFVLFFEFLSFF